MKKHSTSTAIKLFILAIPVAVFFLMPGKAEAAFDPSYIIPDDKFTAKSSMTEAQIQAFLVEKGNYLESYTVPAGRSMVWHEVSYWESPWIGPIGQEVDATGWSAAKVIYNVANWYNLNPQAILATIQKESSLVTTNPAYYGLVQWAMGYAYTEGGILNVCSTATNYNPTGSCAGFAMQVDWGGGMLGYWSNAGGHYLNPVGSTRTIDGVPTYIGNASTSVLYAYTPHFHGNENFYNIFSSWFGNIDHITRLPVYRFYNMKNGTHFYTANEAEKNNVIIKYPTTYRYEGVAYSLNISSGKNTIPLYRFYNFKNGTHFYTANEAEKNNVIATWPDTFKFEGAVYNVAPGPDGAVPVWRFWNVKGTHFYTSNEDEKNNVLLRWPTIFKLEGIGYYIAI